MIGEYFQHKTQALLGTRGMLELKNDVEAAWPNVHVCSSAGSAVVCCLSCQQGCSTCGPPAHVLCSWIGPCINSHRCGIQVEPDSARKGKERVPVCVAGCVSSPCCWGVSGPQDLDYRAGPKRFFNHSYALKPGATFSGELLKESCCSLQENVSAWKLLIQPGWRAVAFEGIMQAGPNPQAATVLNCRAWVLGMDPSSCSLAFLTDGEALHRVVLLSGA